MEDVIIIGAGPCGLAAAIDFQKQGLRPLIIEKGCLVNSIYHYPLSMHFFSTPEKIEIGGVPFTTINEKPSRYEALKYYRMVARLHNLRIHTYEQVTQVDRLIQGFRVVTKSKKGIQAYQTHFLVIATGYYDNPHLMNVPGEELPHVHHYFRDAHPYADQQVVVIGGRNSAIDVALDLQQAGAKVTMVYRKNEFHPSVKAWVKPLIESAIEHGRITMYWETEVQEIKEEAVVVSKQGDIFEIPADTVFAMTGYRPDFSLIQQLGTQLDDQTGVPILTEHMETSVPGCYLAGVVATGHDATKIFIENGRFHGQMIAEDMKKKKIVQV